MNVQHPIAAPRQRSIVGHEHQRRAALAIAVEQKLDDFAAGCLVEIAGGLVRYQDRRVGRDRASATRCCSPPESCAG
jgi:hypothetical protein